jgi:hypothetical protein
VWRKITPFKGREAAGDGTICNNSFLRKQVFILFSIIRVMTLAVHSSETSVCFMETAQRYIPEGSYFHTHRRENLKFHLLKCKL